MTGKERLAHLEAKLRENAANPEGVKFDLGSWCRVLNVVNPISCGTTACAFGFAALLPEFQAEGLRLVKTNNWMQPHSPRFERNKDFWAAAAFFNISIDDTLTIFDPSRYPFEMPLKGAVAEVAVADRIKEYFRTH